MDAYQRDEGPPATPANNLSKDIQDFRRLIHRYKKACLCTCWPFVLAGADVHDARAAGLVGALQHIPEALEVHHPRQFRVLPIPHFEMAAHCSQNHCF